MKALENLQLNSRWHDVHLGCISWVLIAVCMLKCWDTALPGASRQLAVFFWTLGNHPYMATHGVSFILMTEFYFLQLATTVVTEEGSRWQNLFSSALKMHQQQLYSLFSGPSSNLYVHGCLGIIYTKLPFWSEMTSVCNMRISLFCLLT